MPNQYVKVALAVLAAVSVALQAAYPHAAWDVPVTAFITALLAGMHFVPAPAVKLQSQPSGAANVPGS